MTSRALVWFKRDLRVRDHAPLTEAVRFDEALALFVIEPEWLASPECDARHVRFLLDALAPLRDDLAARGLPLVVRVGSALQVLAELRHEFAFGQLLSHEETGPGWSYARDRAVGAWCRAQGVAWQEFAQTGVVRRLRSRAGWAGRWAQRMNAPEAQLASGFAAPPGVAPSPLPTLRDLGLHGAALAVPAAGERAA